MHLVELDELYLEARNADRQICPWDIMSSTILTGLPVISLILLHELAKSAALYGESWGSHLFCLWIQLIELYKIEYLLKNHIKDFRFFIAGTLVEVCR